MTRLPSVLLALLCFTGCDASPSTSSDPPAGTFAGESASGEPVRLSLDERSGTLQAHGEIAGRRLMLAGPVSWIATGAMVSEGGRMVPVRLQQTGPTVTLTTPSEVIVLDRGAAAGAEPAPPSDGPWSGVYEASEEEGVIAELRVTQSGDLLSGSGDILGDPVALAGHLADPDRARGRILYRDGSQIAFSAMRNGAGVISFSGLGVPLDLVPQ